MLEVYKIKEILEIKDVSRCFYKYYYRFQEPILSVLLIVEHEGQEEKCQRMWPKSKYEEVLEQGFYIVNKDDNDKHSTGFNFG